MTLFRLRIPIRVIKILIKNISEIRFSIGMQKKHIDGFAVDLVFDGRMECLRSPKARLGLDLLPYFISRYFFLFINSILTGMA